MTLRPWLLPLMVAAPAVASHTWMHSSIVHPSVRGSFWSTTTHQMRLWRVLWLPTTPAARHRRRTALLRAPMSRGIV